MNIYSWFLGVTCAGLVGGMLHAQTVTSVSYQAPLVAAPTEPELLGNTQRWLQKTVATAQAQMNADTPHPLRMEVTLGQLDSRLKLAPCAAVEPYMPPGSRLWGSTRVALRCMDGPVRWNVFLPVKVKAWGKAWVMRRDVMSGNAIAASDMMEVQEVDWAEEQSPVVLDANQWLGQMATRNLSTGQTLRQNMVRPAQVFQAGTQVRVVATGPGFQIASDAQALSAGVVGQPARVRMEGGRIMSGLVLDARTVRLDL
jgi:flagella basal body P-ring formation protein FlgA